MALIRSRGVRILLSLVGLLAVASLCAAVALYLTFVQDLPDLRGISDYRPPLSSQVLDRDGVPIATYFEQRRRLTPYEEIPRHVVMAFVAGEDSTFFEHSGIDYLSIIRAAWVNLRAGGEIKQGASTITQQMVKGLLLTPERKFRRKIREMILARRIEQHFSKPEILFLYLNQIYFGHGAYGIGEAAETYFGKSVGELSVSEGAMLAGLPKAPSRYSPFNDPKIAEQRRQYVLERMHADGIVDDAGYAAALADLPVLSDSLATNDDPDARYFTEEVRRYLFESLGGDLVLQGGLTVETTLSTELQHAAVEALRTGLRDLDHRQGYRGPVRQTPSAAIGDEVVRVGIENELLDPPTVDPDEAAIEAARSLARERLFVDGDALLGVVTELDADDDSARIAFGPGIEGIVRRKDISWARKADPKRAPYPVRSIGSVFSPGDVARFSALGSAADAASAEIFPLVLHQEPIVQGALLSIDLETQEVVVLVGGSDFEQSQFNRVTQASRQPGSAFKPIIYAAALSSRSDGQLPAYTPATIVYDRPIVYTDTESGFIWRPRNYKRSFYGPITMREALARSVNNATVHLFRDVGMDYVIDYARRLGIESPLGRDLSLALGSSGVSLLELTRAYAVFPNAGRRVVPTFIRSVRDRDGNVLLSNVPTGVTTAAQPPHVAAGANPDPPAGSEPDQVITPQNAYLAVSLLRAVVDDPQGTGGRLRMLNRPLAGKTGTTNDQGDAWFMGFSPDIVTGVWVGHDESRFLGYGETGSRAAAPIWVDYMKVALAQRPVRDFPVPESIEFARIDRKTGLLADASSKETVFEAFAVGTVPTQTSGAKQTSSDSRRELRLDSF